MMVHRNNADRLPQFDFGWGQYIRFERTKPVNPKLIGFTNTLSVKVWKTLWFVVHFYWIPWPSRLLIGPLKKIMKSTALKQSIGL